MYLTADQPTRSLRPADDGRVLVVGGNGHDVGRSTSPQAAVDDLLAWTGRHFPGATPTHRWSAQDYSSLNALPYVGPLVPGSDGILVATGYGKWGLSNGVAAGLVLAGRILGGHMRWADAFQSYSPTQLFDLPAAVKANGEVAVEMVAGWGDALVGRQRGERPCSHRAGGTAPRRRVHLGRSHPARLRRLPAPRWRAPLERRGGFVGLPASRVPIHCRRNTSRGPRNHRSPTTLDSHPIRPRADRVPVARCSPRERNCP